MPSLGFNGTAAADIQPYDCIRLRERPTALQKHCTDGAARDASLMSGRWWDEAAREPYPTDFVATRETPVPHTFSQMTSPNAMGAHRESPAAARATSPTSALGTGAFVR